MGQGDTPLNNHIMASKPYGTAEAHHDQSHIYGTAEAHHDQSHIYGTAG